MAKQRKRTGRGVGGGPKTPDGKQRSSGNAIVHGMRSKILIMPDEQLADFEELERGWNDEFEPEGHAETTLVNALILSDWQRKRAIRRALEAEAAAVEACGVEPQHWSGEHRQTIELMQRYKTTAERSFYRAWNAAQGFRKDIIRFKCMELRTREQLAKTQEELAQERKARQELEELPGVQEIRKERNRTEKRERAEASKAPAERVFQGQGHPRPMGRGGCDGAVCKANRELLEAPG